MNKNMVVELFYIYKRFIYSVVLIRLLFTDV
jgi:hypothetical protein